MSTFKLLDRIRVGGAGIWPIAFTEPQTEAQSARITDLDFKELPDADPHVIGVANSTAFPALLPSGLIIGGLNQSRMVTVSTLIPANMTVGLDVFCVEENRFGNTLSARISGRAPTSFWLTRNNDFGRQQIRRRTPNEDQQAVWAEIKLLSGRLQKKSERALDKLINTNANQASCVEFNPALWGSAQAFAVEAEGSLLMVERFPNSDDARLVGLATASSYQHLLSGAHLFESKESVTRFVTRILQKSFDTLPPTDFNYSETKDKFDEIIHFEFTNFQNRILLNS